MTGRNGRDGLTLAELIFVLVVLVFAIMIILPVLTGMWNRGPRLTCGTNLSGLVKAMLIYANDYDDQFPSAGGPSGVWAARTPDWKAPSEAGAYGLTTTGQPGRASISASLYLLVKYAEVTPKSFVCKDDQQTTRFEPSDYGVSDELVDFWDFGPEPPRHVSYSYHLPYGQYRLATSSPAGLAVAADRNPWMDSPFAKARDFALFKPQVAPYDGTTDQVRAGSCLAHKGDGQFVVFLDAHAEFVKNSNCGVDDDNVYTSWDGADKVRGKPPVFGSQPADLNDSLLVNDPP